MTSVHFIGAALPEPDILRTVYAHGYRLVLESHTQDAAQGACVFSHSVIVLALAREPEIAQFGDLLHRQAVPWIGWNTTDAPERTLAAYAAGARAVLPAAMTGMVLLHAIQHASTAIAPRRTPPDQRQGVRRTYRRGEPIHLAADDVLEVCAGVIAQTMLHRDGCEVVMGLSGPGQLLTGHPDDTCYLQLHAHTDATIVVRAWQDAAMMPHFPERLRDRVRLMEAWSAMQARPHLDQRIMGVLSVLAEQFGVPHPCGLLVDVRMTHAQLAAAIGATRSTVTRLLATLQTRGDLATVGAGKDERYCLCRWEQLNHTQSRDAL